MYNPGLLEITERESWSRMMSLGLLINFIKGNALNKHLFRTYVSKAKVILHPPHFHAEVRWPSHGNVFDRIWILRKEFQMILVKQNYIHRDKFKNSSLLTNLAIYLCFWLR